MGAILLAVEAAFDFAVKAGIAIGPLLPGIEALFTQFAIANGATQDEYDQFHAIMKPYEDDLQAKADAAQKELDAAVAASVDKPS